MLDRTSLVSLDHRTLIAELLTEALIALESGCPEAQKRILSAKTLVLEGVESERSAGGSLAPWQMRRIDDFVHRHLSTGPRIKDAAQMLKMTPCYLSRAFRETAGITFTEFVLDVRLELAKRLLLTTDEPIIEIALTCGLSDQSHLTRIFKKAFGMPPAAWRRRYSVSADPTLSRSTMPGEAIQRWGPNRDQSGSLQALPA